MKNITWTKASHAWDFFDRKLAEPILIMMFVLAVGTILYKLFFTDPASKDPALLSAICEGGDTAIQAIKNDPDTNFFEATGLKFKLDC